MIDLRGALDDWCQSYVTAFSAYDAEGISGHWDFPALILSSGRTLAFKDAEHFNRNTGMLLGFYKEQGVEKAERNLDDLMLMNEETVSIKVSDRMLDAAGAEIITWQAAYVLHLVQGSWKAVCALADGEMAAWQARGTPLGGKRQ